MAFTLDRNEAALRLGVSTRTIDRYIQNEKIRTRRIGKKMFLEEDDVEILREEDSARREDDYEVVENPVKILHEEEITQNKSQNSLMISADAKMAITELSRIYNDAQTIIAEKDETIRNLSYKVGKLETELQNSVNKADFSRTEILLETAENKNHETSRHFSDKISTLEQEMNKKNSFIVALVVLFALLLVAFSVFLFFNRL